LTEEYKLFSHVAQYTMNRPVMRREIWGVRGFKGQGFEERRSINSDIISNFQLSAGTL